MNFFLFYLLVGLNKLPSLSLIHRILARLPDDPWLAENQLHTMSVHIRP